jgi:hypothetical protein
MTALERIDGGVALQEHGLRHRFVRSPAESEGAQQRRHGRLVAFAAWRFVGHDGFNLVL